MKILVFSDSHGSAYKMEEAVTEITCDYFSSAKYLMVRTIWLV